MQYVVRTNELDVEARLAELDLTIEELQEVGRAAYLAKLSCSPLHPPTFGGTSGWAAGVYTLRDQKLSHGWRMRDPGNFSITINDAGRFYVVVATGDQLAGKPFGKAPSTKSPKGLKTEAAVAATRQHVLFPDEGYEELKLDAELASFRAWFLLLNIEEKGVFIELSSPAEMIKGKIVSWSERIIIPALSGDPIHGTGEDDLTGGFSPDIEIDVQRVA